MCTIFEKFIISIVQYFTLTILNKIINKSSKKVSKSLTDILTVENYSTKQRELHYCTFTFK